MRRFAPLVLLAFAAACDDAGPIPGDVPLRIVTGAADVELGKAFPMTVVRVRQKSTGAEAWKDDIVAPLVVLPLETTRREDASHVEETRRFKAYAFVPGDVVVPASGGGTVKLHVRASLDPKEPGPPELPGDPLPEPFPWTIASLGAVASFIASALLVARIRRRRVAPVPAFEPIAAAPPAHVGALRRLEELGARTPRSLEEIEAFHVAAAAIVRDYVAERFGVRVATETSEELGRASLPLTPEHRALLAAFLARCDLVKFARHAPGAGDRAALVASAAAFVTETASP